MSNVNANDNMSFLRDLIYRRSAIVVPPEKQYLIDSRLAPIAREAGLASIEALVLKMRLERDDTPLSKRVVEAMTTNETLFFRDLHPFEALQQRMLPELIKARQKQRSLRIWCAAASTGQEPYSIAMTIREHFPELASWNVQIIATDINAAVLERARTARYQQHEVNRGLPVTTLLTHFEAKAEDWQLKPAIRNLVRFRELNLLDAWTDIGPQDIVFMRNVLIYFDIETKRKLLGRLRGTLQQDGYLLLGGAETTNNIDEQYKAVRIGRGVYYQLKP